MLDRRAASWDQNRVIEDCGPKRSGLSISRGFGGAASIVCLGVAFAALSTMTACRGTAQIEISSVGETMTYDKTSFTVKNGQTVHVILTSHSTSPAMKHNWVLVNPGKEASVAAAGMTAGEAAGYVPGGDANVLAHTPLAQPGGQAETSFTAPPVGTYPFICTFPGHYQTMHGTLTVTP